RRARHGSCMRTCKSRSAPAGPALIGLVLTSLALSRAMAATLTRGPYLQLLMTQSVTVVWDTDTPAACALAIRPPGGLPTVLTGGDGTVCAIAVGGLTPGTSYAYTPFADGVPLAPEAAFRTDDPSRPFTFLALGD